MNYTSINIVLMAGLGVDVGIFFLFLKILVELSLL